MLKIVLYSLNWQHFVKNLYLSSLVVWPTEVEPKRRGKLKYGFIKLIVQNNKRNKTRKTKPPTPEGGQNHSG